MKKKNREEFEFFENIMLTMYFCQIGLSHKYILLINTSLFSVYYNV